DAQAIPQNRNPSKAGRNVIVAELYGSDTASAFGYTVTSSSPVLSLCANLVEDGCGAHEALEAWRGPILCLSVRSIGEAAGLKIGGDGAGFRPMPEPDSAPPMRFGGSPAPDSPPSSRRAA